MSPLRHGGFHPPYGLRMFRDEVVAPALDAIEYKISSLQQSKDLAESVFGADFYAELQQSTTEGFLLTTQSMHERGLRGLLQEMAKRKKWDEGARRAIQSAVWSGGKGPTMQDHFEKLFDAPIRLFGDLEDLNILQLLGSALRHGDGASVEKLHACCPSLWINWVPPGTELRIGESVIKVRADEPRHPSFDNITLSRNVLEQMLLAVFGFWEGIEFVRCNSFSSRNPSTDKYMDELRLKRSQRKITRRWNPG